MFYYAADSTRLLDGSTATVAPIGTTKSGFHSPTRSYQQQQQHHHPLLQENAPNYYPTPLLRSELSVPIRSPTSSYPPSLCSSTSLPTSVFASNNRTPAPFFPDRRMKKHWAMFKTTVCQAWKDSGHCNYGERCRYAHGAHELRRPVQRSQPRHYKTVRCNKFVQFGICPYGDKCQFIHDDEQEDDQQLDDNRVVTDMAMLLINPDSISPTASSSSLSSVTSASGNHQQHPNMYYQRDYNQPPSLSISAGRVMRHLPDFLQTSTNIH